MASLRLGRLLAGTAAALTALTLAACGGSADAPGAAPLHKADDLKDPTSKVVLTYAGAAYDAKALEPVFAAFTKAHPTIEIKYESVPFDQLNSVLSVRLGSGNADLDLFDTDMPRTAAYQGRGWLTDLTPAFGDLSGKIDKASVDAATVDGKLVAMPLQTSSQLLYYNKTLLTKAGIALPSADPAQRMTWEQISADGRKAQQSGAKWGLLLDQVDRYYQLQPLAESLGGGPGGEGKGNLTPTVDNAAWRKAFTWYGQQFADKVSPRGVPTAQTSDLFAAGQVAFYPGGPWWAPKFLGAKGLDFGVAAYPAFAGGKPVTPTGAWSLGLNPNSKNRDAALIFMKFMALDGGGFSQYITDLAVPPANVAGTEKYYAQKTFTDPKMNGAVALLKHELADTATIRLKTTGYIEFEDIMGRAFTDVINGVDAGTALKKAQSELDAAWAKYRK
ncbi:ABC transporter substrate-binding protein [Micromonospora auratinigra]|uniref:Multiple sugar transport system substrate-binding protein n=1 Tax=Micromonospora auratinigra TaxID=261654 RepID=A0A1A8Z9Q5_9ACTN|nr:sugar ABC transporter substrate-binding protein [Micromonospora auratinigra]SBT40539.1 multiple sugar transport system substrate-binding protein [Micromonospora auratinigra]